MWMGFPDRWSSLPWPFQEIGQTLGSPDNVGKDFIGFSSRIPIGEFKLMVADMPISVIAPLLLAPQGVDRA